MKPILGIIGGSGLYSLDGLKNTKLVNIKTPLVLLLQNFMFLIIKA